MAIRIARMDFTSPYSWNERESVLVPNEMNEAQTLSKVIIMENAGAKYVSDTFLINNYVHATFKFLIHILIR
jgi:hypothetical protein